MSPVHMYFIYSIYILNVHDLQYTTVQHDKRLEVHFPSWTLSYNSINHYTRFSHNWAKHSKLLSHKIIIDTLTDQKLLQCKWTNPTEAY